MLPLREPLLRELAAYQECQVEIRQRHSRVRTVPPPYSRNWSGTVAVISLGVALLGAVAFIVLVLSAFR